MGKGADSVTIGYKYFVGVHIICCTGPVDAITKMRFDDRVAWAGEQTTDGQIVIYKPALFGGDEKQGGVGGVIDVMMGGPDQMPNTYLTKRPSLGPNIPAYRGLLGLVFHNNTTGFYWSAMNPYIKAVAPTIRRILKGWHNDDVWYAAKAVVMVDDRYNMNPAHIIVQCMTDPDWGMGYPLSIIGDSFTEAADQLYDEGFGISLVWVQQTPIQEFVKLVLEHICGVVYLDRTAGKFEIKLFRGGYSTEGLLHLDPSNVERVDEYQRAAWGETVNEIVVEYTNPKNEKAASIAVQDLANIRNQGAVVSNKRSYPGIRSEALAYRVAERDLRSMCVPMASVKLTALRGIDLSLGDLFRMTWPAYGLEDVVFRVLSVDYGTLESPTMRVEAVEDVFSLPTNTYGSPQDGLWIPTDAPPLSLTDVKVVEATHYEVSRAIGPGDFSTLTGTEAFPVMLASRPAEQNQWFYVYNSALPFADPSQNYALRVNNGIYTPSVDADGAITPLQTSIPYRTDLDLIYDGPTDVYAHWDDEIIHITHIDSDTETLTVERGVLDSIPQAHADGARIWMFNGGYGGYEGLFDLTRGEISYFKATGVSPGGESPLSSAIEVTKTATARWSRPWPPANVKIDGAYFPVEATTRAFATTWVGRNRLTQDVGFTPWTGGHITPEDGVTYKWRAYNADNNALLNSVDGLTTTGTGGTFTTATLPAARVRVELWAERGGVASEFMFSHTFRLPSYDSALLHFDGTPGAFAFVDDSGKTWTATGNVEHSAAQVKFGTAAAYFDGAVDYITSAPNNQFDLTNDFTVEQWVYIDDLSAARGLWKLGSFGSNDNRMQVVVLADGSIRFSARSTVSLWSLTTAAGLVSTGTWHHVAATRLGDALKLWLNGVEVAAGTATGTPATAQALIIGVALEGFQSYMNGYIDEMRVRNGEAIYTGAFTPPAAAFTYKAP